MNKVEIKNRLPHAAEQCIKVHGVNIHLSEFANRIVSGRAKFACLSSHPDRKFYFVEIEGKTYKVLFSESGKACITVVPLEFRGKLYRKAVGKAKRKIFRSLRHIEEDDQET